MCVYTLPPKTLSLNAYLYSSVLVHIAGLKNVSSVTQFYQEELGRERLRIEQEMQVGRSLIYQLVYLTFICYNCFLH